MPENRRIRPEAIRRIMEHENYWFKFVISTEEDIKEIKEVNKLMKEHLGEGELEEKIRKLLKDGVMEMLKNINYWKSAPLWNKKKISIATKNWFKYIN